MPGSIDYEPSTYGDEIADVYDDWYAELDPAAAVEALAELAGEGPALELAIGSGRIALPLQERGIVVHGIDASARMLDRLRAKPGGDRVPTSLGDFADVEADGAFTLIYVVFNTFFALVSQADQVRCFENVAARLRPGGRFVLEAFVPDPGRFDRGQRVAVSAFRPEGVQIELSRHDPVEQRVETHHVVLGEKGVRRYPLRIRYAWPSELDLMARLAGLRLRNRWGGWQKEPFTAESTVHVSVWEKPPAG